MYTIYSKDSTKVYVGTIKSIREFTKDDKDAVALTIEDFAQDEVIVYFNDGDYPRATNLKKLKLKIGDYIAVMAKSADDETRASGIRAMFKGCFKFKNDNGKDLNVVMGPAIRPTKTDDKFKVTIPLEERTESGEYITKWVTLTFSNYGDKQNADKAERAFGDNEKSVIVAFCGELVEKEYNNKKYYFMNGYRLTRKPDEID